MNHKPAHFLSVLAHPIFINLVCLILLFFLQPSLYYGLPYTIKLYYITYIFLLTSIIPAISVLLLKYTGSIKSILLADRDDRIIPYVVTTSFYLFVYYNFRNNMLASSVLLGYLIACALIIFSVLLINFYSKVSIHMATLGALCGLVASSVWVAPIDIRWLLLFFILISGLVASARYSLGAHSIFQLYLGYVYGFFVMFVFLYRLSNPNFI